MNTIQLPEEAVTYPGFTYNPVRGFYPEKTPGEVGVYGVNFGQLPPLLRTLLVSDGTVTKFLEAYYWEPIKVQRLFHGDGEVDHDLPPIELKKGQSALCRRVLLCGMATKNVYCYAESFIRTDYLWASVRDDLIQGRLGIGELLRDRRVETYRELLTYEMGRVGHLSGDLACPENSPLLTRTYRILIGGKPCLFIDERFPIDHFL